jgi:tetratricopeptide (TPR) repeat protein
VALSQTVDWEKMRIEAAQAAQMGQYRQAEELYKAALAETQGFSAADSRLLTSVEDLVEFYDLHNRHSDAESLLRRAVDLRARNGPNEIHVAHAREDLARNLLKQSRLPDAASELQRSVEILEAATGPYDLELLPALNLLSRVYEAMHNYAESEATRLRAVSIREKVEGGGPELAKEVLALSDFHAGRERWREAESELRRALNLLDMKGGKPNPDALPVIDKLAGVLRRRKELSGAEVVLRRGLVLAERIFGPIHQETAAMLDTLASLLYEEKEYEEVERLYTRSLSIWTTLLEPDHPLVSTGLENVVATLAAQAKYTAAEEKQRLAPARREQALLKSVYNLAKILDADKKWAEAESVYKAEQRLIDRLPPCTPMASVILQHFASVLRKMNKNGPASRLERRAAAIDDQNADCGKNQP